MGICHIKRFDGAYFAIYFSTYRRFFLIVSFQLELIWFLLCIYVDIYYPQKCGLIQFVYNFYKCSNKAERADILNLTLTQILHDKHAHNWDGWPNSRLSLARLPDT